MLTSPLSCPVLHAGNIFRRWDLAVDGVPSGPRQAAAGSPAEAARLAWRNALRCVGRLHWKSLHVVDATAVTAADDIFAALCRHLSLAHNGGRIRPVMTLFQPWSEGGHGIRIWNHQLIRYAGYPQSGGGILGDPASVRFTRLILDLGWRPPGGAGRFDILPLLLETGGRLYLREWPAAAILEVPLRHRGFSWFEKLGLKWYAVPAIADMLLAAGAQVYPAAPFNGWYMGTEIGARNLGDEARYHQLPVIAEKLGLDTSQTRNLWRDHALLVLNEAVLHSFEDAGVRLVDHHQATAEFEQFCGLEQAHGRSVSADWSWIVPPLAGSSTPVFHRSYPVEPVLPQLLLQTEPWETARGRAALEATLKETGTALPV